MKTNSFFTTDYTDYTDEELAFSYPCHPCYPRLTFFLLLRIICLFAIFAEFSLSAQVQQAWATKYNNGMLNGTNQGTKMALDSVGNIIVSGPSQNTNGILGYVTIKYAANGTQVWAARSAVTNQYAAVPTGIVLDRSNNVILAVSGAVVKYDTNGHQLWTAPPYGGEVAVDAGGSIYLTGYGTNFNTEKLSVNGSNIWEATYADVGPTLAQVILVDTQTNIYVAGSDTHYYYGGVHSPLQSASQVGVVKYDVNGNQLWSAAYAVGPTDEVLVQVGSAALDKANNLYLSANAYNNPFQTMMFSNNGALGWVQNDPTANGNSLAHALVLDSAGDTFVTGADAHYYPNTPYPIGTYKIGATNGAYVWTNLYYSIPVASSTGTAIAVDQGNNVYVTGYSPGTNSGNDIVTIKYDNNGNLIWVQRYNGPGNGDDEGNAIAVDASGNVYVTGYDTTAAGGTEMVTIKYAPSPTGSIQTNHAFLLQTQGEPGQPFDIQATTNFTTWLDLGQTNADTNGHLQFLDTNAALFNQRFYTTKPQ